MNKINTIRILAGLFLVLVFICPLQNKLGFVKDTYAEGMESWKVSMDNYPSRLKADENSIYHQSISKLFGTGVSPYKFPGLIKLIMVTICGLILFFLFCSMVLKGRIKAATRNLRAELEVKRLVETDLMNSEKKHRRLISNISDVIAVLDKDGIVVYKSTNVTEYFGWSAEELVGSNGFDTVHLDDKTRIMRDFFTIVQEGRTKIHMEFSYCCKDGTYKPVELTAVNLLDDPLINGVLINYRDISDRKLSEETLIQSEEKYRTMIERSNDMIWTVDDKGCFTFINPQAENVTGRKSMDWIGRSFKPLLPQEDISRINDILKRCLSGETVQYEAQMESMAGEILTLSINSSPINTTGKLQGIVSFGRDITEQRRLETRLMQSQKMEAIGTLAGGIAHDFNNILSGIMGYCQLAQFNLDNAERVKMQIEQIVKSSQRAAELVRQILTFSRQSEYQKQPIKIYLEVKEALKLLRSSIPSYIEITSSLNSKKTISADPIKMHQVLMNLCTNAYHSMRKTGGTLSVSLSDVEFDRTRYLKESELVPGEYVRLEVTDTGCGMDSETLKKAFEPYFTTKNVGQGTGLGLALVHAIVDEHDGGLEIFTEPAKGTSFCLYFPVLKNEKNSEKVAVKEEKDLSGSETIMVVEDEETLRVAYKGLLEKFGYQVDLFMDGAEALAAFSDEPEKYDLIITDMTMPRLTGDMLAKEVLKIRPKIPIVLCTGFCDEINESKANAAGIRKVVHKPFNNMTFMASVRSILDKGVEALTVDELNELIQFAR